MARINVNPTRMELGKLKTRLKTATRGHKLLKDKSDEMVRQFVLVAKENKRLREEVEAELITAIRSFMFAKCVSSSYQIEEAVAMAGNSVVLVNKSKTIMGVEVPDITITEAANKERFPYSFATTTSELDSSISTLSELLTKLVKLAEVEKTCNMLADEIEKNRRRVNALEYVMIPNIQETIKYITMKLEENDRGTITRLMKFKSIMQKKAELEK